MSRNGHTIPLVRSGPLIEAIDAAGGPSALVPPEGRSEMWPYNSYNRAVRLGYVSVWVVDELMVKCLHTLPELVYGDEFFDAEAGVVPDVDHDHVPSPRRKITVEQEDEIVQMYADGAWSQADLARRYGVSQQWVSKLVRGVNKTQLPDPVPAGGGSMTTAAFG